jgi:hypothetical protein
MAITFRHKIILRPGSVFCFGTISSIADEEGTLHRIVDPPKIKSSSKISEKIGANQENRDNPSNRRREEVEPSPALTEKSTSSSAGTGHRKARDSKSSTIVRYW